MMTCRCGTPINNQTPVYRYCPRCGSPTGHLTRLDGGDNVTQGLRVQEGQFSTHTLVSFRNEGLNSITLHAALALPDGSSPQWASLNAVNAQVQPGQTFHLTATFTPAARQGWEETGRLPLTLRLVHNDATRRDPWDAESCRAEMSFTVPLSFIEPAQLEAHEELLIFSERALERTLTLVNLGGQDARIDHFGYPPDFEVSGVNGVPAPAYVPLGWILKPNGLLRMKVRANELPRTAERTPLTIVADGGARRIVVTLLRRPAPQPILKPAFIVGIDIGARDTTIVLRDCESDTIELLRVGSHARNAVECGSGGTPLHCVPDHEQARVGSDARNAAECGSGGTPLHCVSDHEQAGVGSDARNAAECGSGGTPLPCVPDYEQLKQLIDETILAKTGGAEVDVRYVFCMGLLDNSEQYQQQRDALLRAAQAQGFMVTADDFYLRPVCAALHFFIGERRESFRIDDGQWIAVLDIAEEMGGKGFRGCLASVALLRADLTPEGDLTLNVNVQCPMSSVQSLVDIFGAASVSERSETEIPPPRQFAHVFVIGDAAQALPVREQARRVFPERIVHELSPADVTEAVARGAVWVMDTYRGVVAPYRITLRDDAGYPAVDLVQPGVTLPGRARLRTYLVTPQRWAELELVADVEGQPYRLCRLWLPRGETENVEYKLRFDHPHPGILRITRLNDEEEAVMWEGVIA